MAWKNRRVVLYLGGVVVTTLAFTLVYNHGMATLEGRPQPLFRSLEVVFQTFTTTGYGEDAPWQTPQMNGLMIVMQLAGIGLILTAVDVFAVPWIQTALTVDPPTEVEDSLAEHVIICEYTPRGESFIGELDSRDAEYVVVEPDHETATELHEAEYTVIHGDPEETATLERANVGSARAVVADSTDDTNASIVLAARDANPDVQIVTVIEDEDLSRYHRAAGADEVLSPRQLLGESLAGQVPTSVATAVDEGVSIGDDFELLVLPVGEGSELAGRTYGRSAIRDRFEVRVVGLWQNGEFEMPPDPDTVFDVGTTLLVAGSPERLDDLEEVTGSSLRTFGPQNVLIAGFGQSGSAAYDALADTTARLTVLDVEDKENVDVVGDATNPTVLTEAGVEDASVVLLTLADDTTAIFTTLIVRDLNPDVDIVVRANEKSDIEKLYQAGADYVQSLATVSGRMLASTVFEDEEMLAYEFQIEVVKVAAGDLAGTTIGEAAIQETTGCTVLAVVRDDRTFTDLDPDSFRFEAGDEVVLAGEDENISRFEERYGR